MTDKEKFINILNDFKVKYIAYYKYKNGEKYYYVEVISNLYSNGEEKEVIAIFNKDEKFKYFDAYGE